jgi:hypothetical protein
VPTEARYPCDDCGFDCCPADGPDEYYIVNDDVWLMAGGRQGTSRTHDMHLTLCIGCLEDRIGRRLTSYDFDLERPVNAFNPWHTDRLNERLGWATGKFARYLPPDEAMILDG